MNAFVRKPEGILAPSILAADFSKLAEEIGSVESQIDWIHVDVMDGHFVPNLTIGPPVVKSLSGVTRLPLDCHLMVTDPEKWIEPFASAGAQIFTFHYEAAGVRTEELLKEVRAKGMKAGLSINPGTPVKSIAPFLQSLDLVLIMSVHPGFTGQKFMEESVQRVAELNALRGTHSFVIEVDGGVSKSNIQRLRNAGADAFVAGASVFFAPDRLAAIAELRSLMKVTP